MLIRCSKYPSLIFATRRRNTRALSAQLARNWSLYVEIIIGDNWNKYTHIFSTIKKHGSI